MARPVGSTNHQSKALKEMVLATLDKVGGLDYLAIQAVENPTAFMTLLGKILPTQISGDSENPLEIISRIERLVIDPNENASNQNS